MEYFDVSNVAREKFCSSVRAILYSTLHYIFKSIEIFFRLKIKSIPKHCFDGILLFTTILYKY